MLFGRKKPAGMDIRSLKALHGKPLKYVTERSGETFTEKRAGGEGAINITDGEFVIFCGGEKLMRCPLTEVSAAELMNKSGLTVRGFDIESGRQRTLIAYYSDGAVSLGRKS